MAGAIGSTVGAIGTGALAGSAGGAALSAATGGDPAQGAGLGALTGGAMGGLGAVLAPTAGAGQAATTAGEAILNPTAQAAAPGVQTVGDVAAETAMNQVGNAVTPGAANAVSSAPVIAEGGNALSGIGSLLGSDTAKTVGMDMAKEGIGTGIESMQQNQIASQNQKRGQQALMEFQTKQEEQEADVQNKVNKTFSGMHFAQGGGVGLEEGQFIIPADVVSALGNGSTKAGATFLDEFFKG